MSEKIKVFGSSLDPLDGWEKVKMKRAYLLALCAGRDLNPNYIDPYDAITRLYPDLFEGTCEKIGRVPIPTWLTSKPAMEDVPLVTSVNYKDFLESNGCYAYSEIAGTFVDSIHPSPFVMLGVDHSQTGGIVKRLSEHYGPDQISLIVLDAHTDMFDFDLLFAMQKHMLRQTGTGLNPPEVLYDKDFYGCGNFLRHLLEEGAVFPKNLFLLGVNDYPSREMNISGDKEIERYLRAYEDIVAQGVNIIPRAEVESSSNRLQEMLDSISTPYVYISVDMDVGSCASTYAVRFLSLAGLEEKLIYRIVRAIKNVMDRKNICCLGLDVVELDVHYAGHHVMGKNDRAYDIVSNIIRNVFFRNEQPVMPAE